MFHQGQLAVHGLAILLGRNEAGISIRGEKFLHHAVLETPHPLASHLTYTAAKSTSLRNLSHLLFQTLAEFIVILNHHSLIRFRCSQARRRVVWN